MEKLCLLAAREAAVVVVQARQAALTAIGKEAMVQRGRQTLQHTLVVAVAAVAERQTMAARAALEAAVLVALMTVKTMLVAAQITVLAAVAA